MKKIKRLDVTVVKFPETSGDWLIEVWDKPRFRRRRHVFDYRYHWALSTTEREKQEEIEFEVQRWAGRFREAR